MSVNGLDGAQTPRDHVLLIAKGIRKAYGNVLALSDASISVHAGEIVALVGDNGAGKSTLVKILTGVLQPDEGELTHLGAPADFADAHEARLAGVEAVHQHLGLAENLSVYENIFLGREATKKVLGIRFLRKAEMQRQAQKVLASLGVALGSVRKEVTQLSGGQRQFVSLARALMWKSPVVVLDEPTAALSTGSVETVLSVLKQMKADGVGIVLVSHDIPHVLSISDRVVVLRGGADVASASSSSLDPESVVALMTGARSRSLDYEPQPLSQPERTSELDFDESTQQT